MLVLFQNAEPAFGVWQTRPSTLWPATTPFQCSIQKWARQVRCLVHRKSETQFLIIVLMELRVVGVLGPNQVTTGSYWFHSHPLTNCHLNHCHTGALTPHLHSGLCFAFIPIKDLSSFWSRILACCDFFFFFKSWFFKILTLPRPSWTHAISVVPPFLQSHNPRCVMISLLNSCILVFHDI